MGLVLALLAPLAQADVLLDGNQHVGDCNDVTDIDGVTPGLQTACDGFTPLDPVSRDQMFSNPVNFHLSTTTTIDKVQLNGAVDLDGKLQIYLETASAWNPAMSSSHFGTLTGSTFDLMPNLVLGPGNYILLPDGGCSNSSGGTFFYTCPSGGINDFGFSSITLVSTQTSTSRMLNQRRHIGDDNDSDDDYSDIPISFIGATSPSSSWYPDLNEGAALDLPFTLDANRRLSTLEFYRLRDVEPNPLTRARVLVDGLFLGELTGNGNPFSLSSNPLLLAGNHTLRVESATIAAGNLDTISWDDIILRFTDVTAPATLGAFNAVDVTLNAITGVIQTKTANKNFDVDLYALNPFGTGVNTAYTGSVSVDLLNAASDSGARDIYGCRSSWSLVQNLGTATFAGGDNGKKKFTVSYANALRIARIRVTDTSTGAQGCSFDAFSIRPKEFLVEARDDNPAAPGTTRILPSSGFSASTTPTHRAGQPFTLLVTARGEGAVTVSGYDGSPTVTARSSLLGATLGSASSSGWTPTGSGVRSDAVTYSEAGAVRLRVEDTSFTSVDSTDGSTAGELTIRRDDVDVGRFTPDRFRVTETQLSPGCAGFTYVGQPFAFPPAAITLTAVDANDNPTLNYVGVLYKLGATVPQAALGIYDDPAIAGTPALTVPAGAHSITNLGNGSATIALPALTVTRAAPTAPFDAEIGIALPVFTDTDGILPVESPIVLGTAAAGAGVPFVGGGSQMRFGRLVLDNAHGSELLALNVPLRAEYFASVGGGTGFIANPNDTCTALTSAMATLTNPIPLAFATTVAGVNGPSNPGPNPDAITLNVPNGSGQVTVNLNLSSLPWLRVDSNNDNNYSEDPTALATFGVFRSDERRIYQREVVR